MRKHDVAMNSGSTNQLQAQLPNCGHGHSFPLEQRHCSGQEERSPLTCWRQVPDKPRRKRTLNRSCDHSTAAVPTLWVPTRCVDKEGGLDLLEGVHGRLVGTLEVGGFAASRRMLLRCLIKGHCGGESWPGSRGAPRALAVMALASADTKISKSKGPPAALLQKAHHLLSARSERACLQSSLKILLVLGRSLGLATSSPAKSCCRRGVGKHTSNMGA